MSSKTQKTKRIKVREFQSMSTEEWKVNIFANRIIEWLDKKLDNLTIEILIKPPKVNHQKKK